MRRYSIREVMQMDQLLFQLATYEATQGLAFVPSDMDDALSIQKTIAKQFNFFKRMIQNGECTLEELQQLVVTRNGPIANKYHNSSFDESLEMMSQDPEKNKTSVVNDDFNLGDVLRRMMEDIVERNGCGNETDVMVDDHYYLNDRDNGSNWYTSTPKSVFKKLDIPSPKVDDKDLKLPKEIKPPKDEKKKRHRKGDKGKRNT